MGSPRRHRPSHSRRGRYRDLRRSPTTSGCSVKYEGVVGKLDDWQCPGIHHYVVRINPLTQRRDTRVGRRGRPYSENPSGDDGSGHGKQSDLAHLSSPHLAPPHHAVSSMGSRMPDHSFERCDGHHKKVDCRLRISAEKRVFRHARRMRTPGCKNKPRLLRG
jgi:hypothetical protein